MVLYLPGNFQVFKEDMALWVALIDNKRSNNSQYNNAQSRYTIYIYIYIYISLLDIIRLMIDDIFKIPIYSINRFLKNYAKLVVKSIFI